MSLASLTYAYVAQLGSGSATGPDPRNFVAPSRGFLHSCAASARPVDATVSPRPYSGEGQVRAIAPLACTRERGGEGAVLPSPVLGRGAVRAHCSPRLYSGEGQGVRAGCSPRLYSGEGQGVRAFAGSEQIKVPSTKFREDRRNSNGQPFQIAHIWSLAPFFFPHEKLPISARRGREGNGKKPARHLTGTLTLIYFGR